MVIDCWIYAIGVDDAGPIKVGYSNSPHRRNRELRVKDGRPYLVLASWLHNHAPLIEQSVHAALRAVLINHLLIIAVAITASEPIAVLRLGQSQKFLGCHAAYSVSEWTITTDSRRSQQQR